jgi:hypothetical protein
MNLSKSLLMACAIVGMGLFAVSADAGLFGHCHRDACCPEPPPVEVCVMVCNPCTGCPEPVTLCVPCCCAAEVPAVSTRCAIIGQGVTTVTYCCCDFEAKIRWDRCGVPNVVRTRG